MTSLGARVSPEQVAAANALVEAIFSAEQGSINAAYGARYLTSAFTMPCPLLFIDVGFSHRLCATDL